MSFESLRGIRRPLSGLAFLALGLLVLLPLNESVRAQRVERWGEGTTRSFYPDDPIWRDDDTRDIAQVAKFELSKSYDFLQNTFGDPATSEGPALNVNTLGEVPDSSWFTNRLGLNDLSTEEFVRGPDTVEGPAPGVWRVTGRPGVGITPKFTIRDDRGDTYLIKLDPSAFPELPSSVEIISTKIFHAIGYYVPEDYLVRLDLARLQVEPGATMVTETGDRRPIRHVDVEHWLRDQPRSPDGTVRALASRFVPGKVVGSFRFWGTRSDDPNDIYPHERRRELRGLRVFAAWLNHDDARSSNSIDAYLDQNGHRHIRHYLQDFGSTMGSGSTSAQQPRGGQEYLIEENKILKGIGGLGLWTRGWMGVKYPDYPSIGNFEGEVFEPSTWKTEYPNPAFERMDAADAFWAASIASRFTNQMIRAVVEHGRLSDPAAARFLADTLIKRRDKVVAYWISRTNPLDRFEISRAPGGAIRLTFDHAAIRLGVASPDATYHARWSALDNLAGREQPVGDELETSDAALAVPASAWGPADDVGVRYAVVRIRTTHRDHPQWREPVIVTLRDRGGEIDVVGLQRPAMGRTSRP